MFFVLAIVSMLGYALQNVLLVKHARSMDGFSLSFYRNISFVITLLPLLLLSSEKMVIEVFQQWHLLLFAGFGGAIALILRFASYHFIPVSVSHSFTKIIATVLLTVLGWTVFQEYLQWQTLVLIGLLLLATVWLGIQRNHMPHLNNQSLIGISLAVLTALPMACTVFIHAKLSREIGPYVSSYFWEISIAIATFILIIGRWLITGKRIERISVKEFCGIAAASSPTLIGTAGLALAVRHGPVGIVSAIHSTSLVVTALLAWWWYDEKLQNTQWYAIVLIVVGMVCLKLLQ